MADNEKTPGGRAGGSGKAWNLSSKENGGNVGPGGGDCTPPGGDFVSGDSAVGAAFAVTFIRDRKAEALHRERTSLVELRDRVLSTTALSKASLPWLKLAAFGDRKTPRGSLRHDANVLQITGVELDADSETMTFERAVMLVREAKLTALLYTSPSHAPLKPRWRILCPTSHPLPPHRRAQLIARLNGVVHGQASVESFTLSQGFFYGSVNGNPDHKAVVVEGEFIDLRDDLDKNAKGKQKANGKAGGRFEEILATFGDGPGLCGFHEPVGAAAASYVASHGAGFDRALLIRLLIEAVGRAPKDGSLDRRKYTDERYLGEVIDSAVAKGFDKRKDDGGETSVELVRGSAITPEEISWLWKGWLARGKFHLLAGNPGVGKSNIAVAIAAALTRGAKLPDGATAEICDVVVWSGEDDIADTLVPRFLASGGDPDRIHFVVGARKGNRPRPFDPAEDMRALAAAVHSVGNVGLVIVDPVVMVSKTDSHKNAESRRDLQPVVDLAKDGVCAALGITHLKKFSKGSEPLERVTGTIAFTAVARVVLFAARGEKIDDPRRLVRAKSNIGPDGGGSEYRLIEEPVPGCAFSAWRVAWGEALSGTPLELMQQVERTDDDQRASGVVAEAEMFLGELLANGPVPQKEIREACDAHCLSWASVRRAKDRLKIVAVKQGKAPWVWKLPGDVDPTAGGGS